MSSPYHMATNMAADVQDVVYSAFETSPAQLLNEQSEQYLASTVQIDPDATLAAMGFMAAVAPATPGPQGELNLARVRPSDVVTLWKAPVAGRLGVADELLNGFDKGQDPGMGPFFSTERAVAEKYQYHYRNGLQEINVPRPEFERLVGEGVIRRDGLEDASWHVPSAGLDDFNQVILSGPSNICHPE